MSKISSKFAVAFIVLLGAPAVACLWDYDTLQMERQRFPDTLELITGRFVRHSEAFYRWRISDRQQRLEQEPNNLRLLDDLAVAFDKIGEHDQAVEIMQRADTIKPDRYETFANLGTFHIHAGRLEKGLDYIRRAIEINPDAHFGREVYQQLLVEYVLTKQSDDQEMSLPLNDAGVAPFMPSGFAQFVLDKREPAEGKTRQEIDAAIKGVLGMMRFGDHRSPVLLEALGDLLRADPNEDAKRLATRAYLKASYEVDDDAAKKAYRKMAESTLTMQTVVPRLPKQLSLKQMEGGFKRELAESARWYKRIAADEARWIKAGADVDAEFTKKYFNQQASANSAGGSGGAVTATAVAEGISNWLLKMALVAAAVLIAVVVVIVAVVALVTAKRKSSPAHEPHSVSSTSANQ